MTYTDLVIGSAGNEAKLSSVLRPFVASDVGNLLNVTGGVGFTTGRYQVLSVAAGVATMDRAVGTAASTGGAGRLGGAITLIATALAAMVAGNTVYLRGSFTEGAGLATTTAGTLTAPNTIIGYGTVRGDGERATITATAAFTDLLSIDAAFWILQNLHLDCDDTVQTALNLNAGPFTVQNCRASQWTRHGFRVRSAGSTIIDECEADNGTGGSSSATFARGGFCQEGGDVWFKRCVSRAHLSNGFSVDTGNGSTITDCVAFDCQPESATNGSGLQVITGGVFVKNCDFVTCGLDGVRFEATSAPGHSSVDECIFADITGFGMRNLDSNITDPETGYRFRNNAFFDCTLGNLSQLTAQGTVALTVSPFVAITTGDLRLNDTAGGGGAVRGAGVLGTLPGLSLSVGVSDVGALQAGGDGGGLGSMTDLFREWTAEFSATRLPQSAVNRYLQSGLESFNDVTGYNYADDTATVLVAGTQEYVIPEDALEIVWVEHNGARLEKGDVEQWESKGKDWRRETATTPTYWAIYGNRIVLRPKPDSAAVAASGTLTIRYIRSPRDIGTFGPEQLVPAHYRTVVRYAVYEYSAAHPDSAAAQTRRAEFKTMFEGAAAAAAEFYLRRRMARGAPAELLLPSGAKRK